MSSSDYSPESSPESTPKLTPVKTKTQASVEVTQISDGTWSQATYPSQSLPKRKAESPLEPLVDLPPHPLRGGTSSTLLKIPADLKETRQRVFSLEEPIKWTAEQFNRLWPYMDTFWVCNQARPMTKRRTVASYWYCRLWSGPSVSEGHGKRAKKLRTTEPCHMKLKINKQYNQSNPEVLESVLLSLHLDKKECSQHNHSLEYADHIKNSSAVMSVAAVEVSKGYRASEIKSNLTGVKWTANLQALQDAGGQNISLNDIYNAGASWKRKNPDERK